MLSLLLLLACRQDIAPGASDGGEGFTDPTEHDAAPRTDAGLHPLGGGDRDLRLARCTLISRSELSGEEVRLAYDPDGWLASRTTARAMPKGMGLELQVMEEIAWTWDDGCPEQVTYASAFGEVASQRYSEVTVCDEAGYPEYAGTFTEDGGIDFTVMSNTYDEAGALVRVDYDDDGDRSIEYFLAQEWSGNRVAGIKGGPKGAPLTLEASFRVSRSFGESGWIEQQTTETYGPADGFVGPDSSVTERWTYDQNGRILTYSSGFTDITYDYAEELDCFPSEARMGDAVVSYEVECI